MRTETTNKRKRDGEDAAASPLAVASDDAASGMQAQMQRMQNAMDIMNGRVSRLGALERHSTSMQNEMNGMKKRLSDMEELEQNCQRQENRCNFLEARCGSLERAVRRLVKHEEWSYSAQDIPTSTWHWQWENQAFDLGYMTHVESFLKRIKALTFGLRNGICGDEIILEGGLRFDHVNAVVMDHDGALSPHWTEFTDALQLYENPEQRSHDIIIRNLQLPCPVTNSLIPALKENLSSLILDNNDFGHVKKGIEFAVELISRNESMTHFTWVNSQINDMNDANYLLQAVIKHECIESIRFNNCFGPNASGYDVLCLLLASDKDFLTIDFQDSNIQTSGGTELPDFLAANHLLKNLVLSDNGLTDNDVILMAGALKQNTNLTYLDIDGNNFTDIGGNAIREAIFDDTDLETAANSNHTCRIVGIDPVYDNSPFHNCPKRERGKKIYTILSERNRQGSNVHHLNLELGDDSLKLVPGVLACVQTYFGYSNSVHRESDISILFELTRSWKMPTLYEHAGTS